MSAGFEVKMARAGQLLLMTLVIDTMASPLLFEYLMASPSFSGFLELSPYRMRGHVLIFAYFDAASRYEHINWSRFM